MGIRRLRGRLNQIQGEINQTTDSAQAVLVKVDKILDAFTELLESIEEKGLQLDLQLDDGAAVDIAKMLLLGKGGTFPIHLDVAVDDD